MKQIALLAVLFTSTASQSNCNEQERLIVKEVARKKFGFDLIYATDESMSSVHSLDTVFKQLEYSFRDPQIPFIFDTTLFNDMALTPVEAPGFCLSSSSYSRTTGYVSKNETMFGVFYGCNLFNPSHENIYIITNKGHPLFPSMENIPINRDFESKFCRCREFKEAFIKECLAGSDNTNLVMLVALLSISVVFVIFIGWKAFVTITRGKSNAVTAH